jgi:hypothetical protein
MLIRNYFKSFYLRQALSVGLTVFVSVIVNSQYSYSGEYWVVLSAFMVSQTTRGTPVRQGMIFFLIMIAAIIVSAFLMTSVEQNQAVYLLLAILFVISSYLAFLDRPQANKTFFLMVYFSIIMLIATLSPIHSGQYMQNRVFDALIGAVIGIMGGMIIFPARINEEFTKGIIPILNALNSYSQVMKDSIQGVGRLDEGIIRKKLEVENTLQTQHGMYPEWVYETGFNRGVRAGLRFFLVNLERITEVLFSMEYILYQDADPLIFQALSDEIANVMSKNQELLGMLIDYFQYNRLTDAKSDFTSDIAELEKSMQRIMPTSLELLEISPARTLITAFVRDLRDLRGLILQLVMALQAPVQNQKT